MDWCLVLVGYLCRVVFGGGGAVGLRGRRLLVGFGEMFLFL